MRIQTILGGLLATAIPLASATALTTKVDASEKACFFADVPQQDTKIAFYFAVRLLRLLCDEITPWRKFEADLMVWIGSIWRLLRH